MIEAITYLGWTFIFLFVLALVVILVGANFDDI